MRINSKKYKNQFDLDAILRHTKEQKYASSQDIFLEQKKKRKKKNKQFNTFFNKKYLRFQEITTGISMHTIVSTVLTMSTSAWVQGQ